MKAVSFEFVFNKIKEKLGPNGKAALLSAFICGLLTHMFIMVSDIPNHDGLASVYFDQNMITSGRWFLIITAGISSFYSLPWLIGLLSVAYLSVSAALMVKIFNIENSVFAALAGMLLVTFPTLASNFAYVFTMDGYMLGLLLCIAAVYMVRPSKDLSQDRFAFVKGGLFLGFGMGTYQSYLCVTMLICLCLTVVILLEEGEFKAKIKKLLQFIYMGITGLIFYYAMLRILLLIQNKSLADYQGINSMTEGNGIGILSTLKLMYSDFVSFTLAGKVLMPSVFAAVALILLAIIALYALTSRILKRGLFKKPLFYVTALVVLVMIPCITNAILLISAEVTYHVLMRYQWVVFVIFFLALIEDYLRKEESSFAVILAWISIAAVAVLVFSYAVTDNIAYSNLSKKYEKTYAYCLRLADRIEQTEGYYKGIPVAMVGVVGNDNFPLTDVTESVTGSLIGMNGDYLLYRGENYADFFRHYLGITMNILPDTYVVDFYNTDFYAAMPSFPDAGSTMVYDGILYVKTENVR